MAVSYRTQKCNSCASTKLEYDKETKLWHCMYCGAVIERHEEVDTLFTIKNVVRQTLVDVAYVRLNSARNNLVECEKIDSKYVGTLIASIAYEMNMYIHGGQNASEQRNMIAQLKKNYMALKAISETPTEEEFAIYEFLESSEAVGVLIIVFDSLGDVARRDALFEFFTPQDVYSQALNSTLVNFAVKNEKFDLLDQIIENTDNIDVKSVIRIILDKYPDNEQKAQNILALLKAEKADTEEDRKTFANYLEFSSDSVSTKYEITNALMQQEIYLPVSTVMKNVISDIDDPQKIYEMIRVLMKRHLLDAEVSVLVEYSIQECSDTAALLIFEQLKETGQFVDLSYKHFLAILKRNSSVEQRIQLLNAALAFRVNDKTKENFVSAYLCEVTENINNRERMLDYLFTLVDAISTASIEKYLLSVSLDAENKPTIVKKIFSMNINKSFFRNTLSSYFMRSSDQPAVAFEIIDILTGVGLSASVSSVCDALLRRRFDTQNSINILRRLKTSGLNYHELLPQYIGNLKGNQFDSAVFAELLSGQTSIPDTVLVRYLLSIRDLAAAKVSAVQKMLSLCRSDAGAIRCNIQHAGETVSCNLVQAYILICPDEYNTAVSILSALSLGKSVLQAEVSASGSSKKFKKYIVANRDRISKTTADLCTACGVL